MKQGITRAGRPAIFKNVKDLKRKIDKFYAYVNANNVPLTLERLAFFLQISRGAILGYSKKDGFAPLLKKVKLDILAQHAENLLAGKGNPKAQMFYLSFNGGYRDKQDDGTNRPISTFAELVMIAYDEAQKGKNTINMKKDDVGGAYSSGEELE